MVDLTPTFPPLPLINLPFAALVFHNFGVRFLSCCGRLIKINEVRRLFILLPDRMYKACPMPSKYHRYALLAPSTPSRPFYASLPHRLTSQPPLKASPAFSRWRGSTSNAAVNICVWLYFMSVNWAPASVCMCVWRCHVMIAAWIYQGWSNREIWVKMDTAAAQWQVTVSC